jgi:hypothetical protein
MTDLSTAINNLKRAAGAPAEAKPGPVRQPVHEIPQAFTDELKNVERRLTLRSLPLAEVVALKLRRNWLRSVLSIDSDLWAGNAVR